MNDRKIAGIVCEYNPFHTGHEYQIQEIRKMGYEKIVCVMSGNTVQRGEFAVMDKYSRAEVAIKCGADLVVELPYPYSTSGAEFFASAAVKILSEVGVGTLCFGSESADIDALGVAAKICESDAFAEEYKKSAASEKGTADAYFDAYKKVAKLCEINSLPKGSNDLLAIAYIRAIVRNKLDLDYVAIKREGCAYKEKNIDSAIDVYPSAIMIRNAMKYSDKNGTDKLEKAMPDASLDTLKHHISKGDAPIYTECIESAILAFFRLADAEILSKSKIAEAGGGLAQRLCKCAKNAKSYSELVAMASGKKYTESRIKRAILACMIGATEEDIRRTPAYSTVLAFNQSGRELLATLRKREDADISFVVKPSDASALSEKAARQSFLAERADSLFTLAKPTPTESAEYLTRSPLIIE